MLISRTYKSLRSIAQREFGDIVVGVQTVSLPSGVPLNFRLDIVDGSLLDIFISVSGRYSCHWERRSIPADDLYRHDNAPHQKWQCVETFPKHFHNGSESNVVESHISNAPEDAMPRVSNIRAPKVIEFIVR